MENKKTALVTGCNRGLGLGIATSLWATGNYKIIGLNRTPAQIKWFDYKECLTDVSNSLDVELSYTPEQLDLLVLNAGIRRFSPVENMTNEDWESSVATNLNGVFYVAKKYIPKIKESKGDIIIVGSHSEKYTFENGAAYCSTKGALRMFAECLMQELRYDDVRVSYLSLGSIKNRDHGIEESWKLTPEEVGKAVVNIVELPKKVLIPYIDIRPAKPLKDEKPGIEKLQYV